MRTGTFAFLLGICLLWRLPALPPLWLLSALPVFAVLASRHVFFRLSFLFTLGVAWAALSAAWALRYELPESRENRVLPLVATVSALPAVERGRLRLTVRAEVVDGTALESWRRPEFRLSGRDWQGEIPRAGERWLFSVRLRRPHGVLNPGADDSERWLFEQGVRANGSLVGRGQQRRLERAPAWTVDSWRERLRAAMQDALGERALGPVVIALVLGDDEAVPDPVWEVFRRTGTAHLVAISGSHITLVAGFVYLLVYWLWRRAPRLCLWQPASLAAGTIALLTAVIYSLLAGFGVPVQRALLMLFVLSLALLRRSKMASSTAFCLSLWAVLLYDARAALSPGFWLSFGAVAVILWLAGGRARASGWRVWLRLQLGISLALTPLLLLLFQQASLVSPLANVLAVPWLGFVTLPLSLLGTLLMPWWPAAGAVLLRLAETTLAGLYPLLAGLSSLDAAVWTVGGLAPLAVLAASLGLFCLVAPRGLPARALGLVLLLPLLGNVAYRPARPALRLTVLDVGQGLSAVVETRGHVLVFDAGYGEPGGYSNGSRQVAPFLRAAGYRGLDALVVSHGDADHAGGVPGLLASLPAARILSSVHSRYTGAEPCRAGQSWIWDGVLFRFLHPDGEDWQGNNGSCVLRITAGEHSLLLTGDIEARAEQVLLNRVGTGLRARVLVAPHHGSAGSSSPDFVAAVRPELVLFPMGYANHFGFPREKVVRRYERLGATSARTDQGGALIVDLEPGRAPALRSYRAEVPRLWRSR